MEKIYLKDLEEKELKEIIINNDDFMNMYRDNLYELNMEMQEHDSNYMLGNNWQKYIDVIDNYCSFYLRVKDYYKFIDNLDKDYLSADVNGLYEKALGLKEQLYNLDYSCEDYEDKEEELTSEFEKTCDLLLADVEKLLHEYEEYPLDDDTLDYIISNEFYVDYYTNSEKKVIYEDIIKMYK